MMRAGDAAPGLVIRTDAGPRTIAAVLHGHVGVTLTYTDGTFGHFGDRYLLQLVTA